MKKVKMGLMICFAAMAAGAQLHITTPALPDGDVGLPYTVVLEATNGTPPYTWSWSRSGNDFPYAVSSQPNSFAAVGTAQGWHDTWGNVPLLFSFPFLGGDYTECWVNPNGYLYIGSSLYIRVLNSSLSTASPGDVYVESGVSSVTIRWEGDYQYNPGSAVSFSVTLHSDGTIVMKYGSGNINGGEIGLSGGGIYYQHPSSYNSMWNAPDIVFTPSVPTSPVAGLAMSTNGVISGVPSGTYDDGVVIRVEDSVGSIYSDWFGFVVHDDRDQDGMKDQWERLIVDDDLFDGIESIGDVLRDDDYDGDGFSNIEEFLRGFDPVVADGNPLDTVQEGLELVAKAFSNDVDAAYFDLIDGCFATVLAAEPTNHSARVYRAASRLANLANAEDLYDIYELFGFVLSKTFMMTGEFDFATAPLPEAVGDIAITNILPALDASYADLEMIPSNWTGTVEISTNYFPVDETVYADTADLMVAKATLKAVRGLVLFAHAQKLNVDYGRFVLPIDSPATAISIDGETNDWASVPKQLIGEMESDIDYVKAAWNGSSIYVLMAFRDAPYEFLGGGFEMQLGYNSSVEVDAYPAWNYTNIWFSAIETNTTALVAIPTNLILEVEVPVPSGVTLSNACVTGAWAEFGQYIDLGGYGYWNTFDTDLYNPDSLPVDTLKQNHPEFLQYVRDVPELVSAKGLFGEAIDLLQVADGMIRARTDALMHVIEYDPDHIAERDETLARIQQGEEGLASPQQVVVTNDTGEVVVDEAVHLGALFQPAYLNRNMLPQFWQTMSQPMLETAPDPTFGGIFPNVTSERLLGYLWKGEFDTDWDYDGIPNGWEMKYFGHPTNANANADGDGDGQTTGDEFFSGSNPTNRASFFKADFARETGGGGIVVSWQSAAGRKYDIHWCPELGQPFQLLVAGLEYPTGSYTDTVHSASAQGFYRVIARVPGANDLDADGLPDDWEGMYFASHSATTTGDGDGDGQDNISEYIAGTDPLDAGSFFAVTNVHRSPAGVVVEWVSKPDRSYTVKWAPGIGAPFQMLATGLEFPIGSYTDTVHNAASTGFYKVDVEAREPPDVEGYWTVQTFDGQSLGSGEYIDVEFYSDGYFEYWSSFDSGGGTYTLEGRDLQMTYFNEHDSFAGQVDGDTITGTYYNFGMPHSLTITRW